MHVDPTACVIDSRHVVDHPAAYGCKACGEHLGKLLATIVEFTPDARALAAGEIRRGPAAAGSGGETRLPINLAAGSRLAAAQNAITTWARHVAAERKIVVPTGQDSLVTAAGWLTSHIDWIRQRPEFAEAYRDIAAVARLISTLVDKPSPRRYAGPCSSIGTDGELCGADLYARPGSPVATCRRCGWEYDVDGRQAWMREQVREHLARPVEIASILVRLGFPIGYSTVAAYVAHHRIEARAVDGRGRPLFRIGDVIDLRTAASQPAAAVSEG